MEWLIPGIWLYVLSWAIFLVALVAIPANRKPGEATAWLLLIFAMPLLGLILFLVLGSPKLPRARRARQRTITETIADVVKRERKNPALQHMISPEVEARYQPFVCLNQNLSGIPAFSGNSVELLADYDGSITRMAEDVERAERFVHVEFFILALDKTTEPFFAAMERAVQRGVPVRLLMDHLGCMSYPGYKEMLERLTRGGIQWHLMLPFKLFDGQWSRPDLRNHRKIVIVDGRVGFTGSQNMIDKTYLVKKNLKKGLYYQELMACVRGPVVYQLDAAFRTDWYSETNVLLDRQTAPESGFTPVEAGGVLCQVVPSGSGFESENNQRLFTGLFHAATRRITIANPYFVPDEPIIQAVTSASQRGVEVTLVTSAIGDQFMVFHAQRSYYEELLKAGVKIYLFDAPCVLHSKHFSIDDDICVIGSSNMDIRSMLLNMEVTLVVYDRRVVADLDPIYAMYIQRSRPLRLDEWQARPALQKFYDNTSRLTASLQ
ncbi:MAG: cardiolipin synthase [Chloroflexales bacterium]|nr:cardiolipin synthase [Chloroflexales bacterium]